MVILPQPREVEIIDGKIIFEGEYFYKPLNGEYEAVTKKIASFLKFSEKAERKIIFKTDESFGQEEYILEIDDDIVITSLSAEGAFRAVTTLKQLVIEKTAEKQKIHDYPMIKKRGIMLDISRGKIPKTESILRLIDMMSDLKYNELQLYMESLVFEYEHFQEYVKGNMPITRQELSDIKKYCEERFISLVPNQNGFGHMGQWLEKEELAHLAITREDGNKSCTLNPFKKESIELVDTIYSDLLPYFDAEYVNVGMDEPFELGMSETKEICEKEGHGKVYVEYLNKILRLAKEKYNKIPMFWDDIVFNYPEHIKDVNPDCIVMDWGYEQEFPFMERCRYIKENGLKFYTCPGTSTWASFTGRFENMVYNLEAAAKACIAFDGDGFLLTDWGDGGHPQFIVMSFLPYIYGACCSWNYSVSRELTPISHAPLCKMEGGIIDYCIDYADKMFFNGSKVGRVLRKAANYYLLENNSIWNLTCVWLDTENAIAGKKVKLDTATCKQIVNYMESVKEELSETDKNTPYLDEIICNCDMVILSAKFIASVSAGEKNAELKSALEDLKIRFIELWKRENRAVGYDRYSKKIDKMIEIIS